MARTVIAAIALSCALVSGVRAAEPIKIVELDPALAPDKSPSAYSSEVDFAYGASITSNYVSGGETQSDDKPAFQAWGTMSSGIVYAGIWLSTVKLDPDEWEFDLAWGIRPTIGALSLDFGYTRYFYDQTGDDGGEWIAGADYEVNDNLTLSGEFAYDPQTDDRSAGAGLTVAFLEKFELSGDISDDLVTHETDWNAGLTWLATDAISLDFRYHDAEFAEPRYVVTLTFEGSTGE